MVVRTIKPTGICKKVKAKSVKGRPSKSSEAAKGKLYNETSTYQSGRRHGFTGSPGIVQRARFRGVKRKVSLPAPPTASAANLELLSAWLACVGRVLAVL